MKAESSDALPDITVQSAHDLQNNGHLEQAAALYHQALESAPLHFEALHALGVIATQQGRYEDAGKFILRALAVDPANAYAHNHLGVAYQGLQRFDDAVSSYRQAIALMPANAEAHNNLGNILKDMGRLQEALASYSKAVEAGPDYPEVHNNHGVALRSLGRPTEALMSFDRAIRLRPDFAEAHINSGVALGDLKRWDDAVASYDIAISLQPGSAVAHLNRGAAMSELRRWNEALAEYDKAIALHPNIPEAHNNRGNALRAQRRMDEALESYAVAIRIRPAYVEAYVGQGNALMDARRTAEALASYERALKIKPDNVGANWNQSLCRLLIGDFRRGWEQYEYRWRRGPQRQFKEPVWRGNQDLRGKTILLWAEQGLGDTIQFCRYAKLVADRGATVVVEAQPALAQLLRLLGGVDRVVVPGNPLPEFDYQCPMLGLPRAFGTVPTNIPASIPYLYASPQKSRILGDRLGSKTLPRIGLVWSGAATDPHRSIPLNQIRDILSSRYQWFSLQKEVSAADHVLLKEMGVVHSDGDLEDFADTAALVDLMDLVISIDTSVAHLSGAMAKTTWVLLSYCADWRWMLDRDDSPWYPTLRLFRQTAVGDWAEVVQRIKREIDREFESTETTHQTARNQARAFIARASRNLRNMFRR